MSKQTAVRFLCGGEPTAKYNKVPNDDIWTKIIQGTEMQFNVELPTSIKDCDQCKHMIACMYDPFCDQTFESK